MFVPLLVLSYKVYSKNKRPLTPKKIPHTIIITQIQGLYNKIKRIIPHAIIVYTNNTNTRLSYNNHLRHSCTYIGFRTVE